jgi:hypothetical protein
MFGINRRAFLALLVSFAPATRLLAFAGRPSPAPIALADFVELSARLLGRPKLDPEVAKIYLDALLADPNSAVTLAYLVESNNNPTPEMKVLSATIIEWWYTGIYTIKGERRLATHTGALVWDALNMPAPGTCASPFGAWSQPPVA